MLHQIIHYSVNEVAYNEGLIGRNVGFVISRGDCILFIIKQKKILQFKKLIQVY
jgi:hypothetical protein